MKERDIMSFALDKYIDEASPVKAKRDKRKRGTAIFASIAACMFIALGLWMFIPTKYFAPSVSRYRGKTILRAY